MPKIGKEIRAASGAKNMEGAALETCCLHPDFLNYEPQQNIMKKTMILIAAFAILLTSISATVDERRVAAFGKEAPAVVAQRNGRVLTLDEMRGKWIVLSFWSSTDAMSLVTENRIAAIVKSSDKGTSNGATGNDAEIEFKTPAGVYSLGKNAKAEVLSVNVDSSERLMSEIIKIDNLLESSQVHVNSAEEINRLRDAFKMNNGLRSFVIDPDGNLVMADPDELTLQTLLANR
jgi:hypothetical protein